MGWLRAAARAMEGGSRLISGCLDGSSIQLLSSGQQSLGTTAHQRQQVLVLHYLAARKLQLARLALLSAQAQ